MRLDVAIPEDCDAGAFDAGALLPLFSSSLEIQAQHAGLALLAPWAWVSLWDVDGMRANRWLRSVLSTVSFSCRCF